MRIAKARLSLLAALVLAGACHFLDANNPKLAPDIPTDPDTETFAPSLHVNIASMHRTVNGVFYSDTKAGTGAQLDSAVAVVLDYSIYLKDGTLIASNQQTGQNMKQLIDGLTEGMLGIGATGGMREGGIRLIVIPSELAYKNVGRGNIPPNATVIYNVGLDLIP